MDEKQAEDLATRVSKLLAVAKIESDNEGMFEPTTPAWIRALVKKHTDGKISQEELLNTVIMKLSGLDKDANSRITV